MNNFEKINYLVKNSEWSNLDNLFSSIKELPNDKDGNPISVSFFSNNVPNAIISLNKFHPINQNDLLFYFRFSSRTFKKNLIKILIKENVFNPKLSFDTFDKLHYNFLSKELLEAITEYQEDNNNEKLFDSNFINIIFSKKEFNENNNPYILTFLLNNSQIESSLFLFSHFILKENFPYVNIIIDFIKNNINSIDQEKTKIIFDNIIKLLNKKITHPFIKTPLKNQIITIIESIKKIQLYFNFEENKNEINKINKHKI